MLGVRRRAQPGLGPAALKNQTGEYSTGGNGEYSSGGDRSYDNYADGSACAKGLGKLCETRTTHGVTRKVAYDGNGRPLSTRTDYGGTAGGGSALSATSSVSYDSVGRVAVQTYPSGLAVRMQYTARGYLEALKLESAVTVNPLPAVAGNRPGASTALGAGSLLWQAKAINAWGKAELQSYGNGIDNRAVFDAQTGRLQQLTAGKGSATDVVNQRLTWDSRTGQLWSRVDALGDGGSPGTSIEVLDTHEYDPLGRLTKYTVSGGSASSPSTRAVELQYNALGMLLYKSDVGVYTYPTQGVVNGRPHAVQSIAGALYANYGYDLNGSVTSATGGKYRSVSYTSFNLPDGGSGIAGPGGSPRYTWQYDESHARIAETRTNAQGTRTTWFLHPDNQGGLGFEREIAPNGAQSNRHYLSAGGSVIGVIVTSGALPTLATGQTAPAMVTSIVAVKLEYWHKDHLGSTVATTDHDGTVTQRYAYDPFGKRRYTSGTYDAAGNLVLDWTTDTNAGNDRGFTGHEHLDDVGLIHMNGRVFDPVIARFMQADPFIQDPGNLQNYDRFTYCYNNPTTCTDPSGYFSWKKLFKAVVVIVVAIYAPYLLETYGGFAAGTFATGITATSIGTATFTGAATAGFLSGAIAGGSLKSGLQGAFSAGLFYGAGDLIAGTGAFSGGSGAITNEFAQVAIHGVAGCITSVVGGGKCGPGALSAAFSKTLAVNNMMGAGNPIEGAIKGAVAGGLGSMLGGGKFENGAMTGAFSYLFNCGAHDCWDKAKPVPISASAEAAVTSGPEAVDQVRGVGPMNASTARRLSDDAVRAAVDSGLPDLWNGPADAVRHCTWSCSMAQALGTDQAKIVGDIHELKGNSGYGGRAPQPRSEFIMDTWNNQTGRDLAPSARVCSAACGGAYRAGKLVGLDGKPF